MSTAAPQTASPSTFPLREDLTLTLREARGGRPALILHGGGGPATVAPIVEHLHATGHHVVAPTHPGWDGTPRPTWFDSVDDLAHCYLHLLEDRDLSDVLVVGSSVGGWIGAEMAVRDHAHRIGRLVLVDSVGVDVAGEQMPDFFALDPREIAEHSFFDPDRFEVDPAALPDSVRQQMADNMATLRVFAGDPYMHDPRLLRRLERVRGPVDVVWGEADRIVTPASGRALARAAGADFHLIERAGHLPQLKRPEALWSILDSITQPA